MKKLILFLSIFIAFAFTYRDSSFQNTLVVLSSESTLNVKGTTNVSNFSCTFNVDKFKSPIQVYYKIEANKMVFDKTILVLDSNCFDCGGKAINNDFKKILKAETYPHIKLYLKEISLKENSKEVNALVNIEIAGITKSYKIPVKIKNNLLINGSLDISLADYKLESPKKLFGLIAVNDKISINFQLDVKER